MVDPTSHAGLIDSSQVATEETAGAVIRVTDGFVSKGFVPLDGGCWASLHAPLHVGFLEGYGVFQRRIGLHGTPH